MLVKFPNGAVAAAAIAGVGILLRQLDLDINCDDQCSLITDDPVIVDFVIDSGDDVATACVVGTAIDHDKAVRTLAEFEKALPPIAAELAQLSKDEFDHGDPIESGNAAQFSYSIYKDGAVRVGCMTFPPESARRVAQFAQGFITSKRTPRPIEVTYEEDGGGGERTNVEVGDGKIYFDATGESIESKAVVVLAKKLDKLVKKTTAKAKAKPAAFRLFA